MLVLVATTGEVVALEEDPQGGSRGGACGSAKDMGLSSGLIHGGLR